MIYVYGDSHASQFRGHDDIKVFSTNSVSIHKLTTEGPGAYIKDERPAVLVFGEIDVRCLIYPQIAERGRDPSDVLDDLADRYIKLVEGLKGRVIVCSVTPASDHIKDGGMDGYPGWQPGFWKRQGPLQFRIFYTLGLNSRLRRSGLPFLDIHNHYAGERRELLWGMTQDGVHICPSQNSYMIEKLRKMI